MPEDLLDIYTDYLISQNQYATATGLSALLDGQISHDRVIRFLNNNQFNSKDLWLYIKPEIHRHEEEKGGVLIIRLLSKFHLFAKIKLFAAFIAKFLGPM